QKSKLVQTCLVSQLTSRRLPVLRTGNSPYTTPDHLRRPRVPQPPKLAPLTHTQFNSRKRDVQNAPQKSTKRAKPLRWHAKTISQFQRLCPSSVHDVVVTALLSHGHAGQPGWSLRFPNLRWSEAQHARRSG